MNAVQELMARHSQGEIKDIPSSFWSTTGGTKETIASRVLKKYPKRVKNPILNGAVGVTTATRSDSTVDRCIASLKAAGWTDFRLFDDDSGRDWKMDGVDATVRSPASGAWTNWWMSLQEMSLRSPNAEYYLVVQDDAVFVEGAKRYAEDFLSKNNGAVLSLYCSAKYSDRKSTFDFDGGDKFVGAVALLFPREIAERLLSSGLGWSHRLRRHRGNDWIDGAIGGWCERHRVPLRILVPGLCQHVGFTSTLGHKELPSTNVASSIPEGSTTLESDRAINIGVIGWNTPQGLGYLNRDFCKRLPAQSFYSPEHPRFPRLPDVEGVVTYNAKRNDWKYYDAFLKLLDVVFFAESPVGMGKDERKMLKEARRRGTTVVCSPMIEWLPDAMHCRTRKVEPWTDLVDLYLCPTQQCFQMMNSLPEFSGKCQYVPWPIDSTRLESRIRRKAMTFVFCHGNGGLRDRKGGEVMCEAARLCPEVPLIVYTQVRDGVASHQFSDPEWPEHVQVRRMTKTTSELYQDGDVCIQPSRLEGLGLQLIECQASGMPLITTDGDPMREYQPYRLIRCTEEPHRVQRALPRWNADPRDLARLMREVRGQDISDASKQAIEFSKRHSWEIRGPEILDLIKKAVNVRRTRS